MTGKSITSGDKYDIVAMCPTSFDCNACLLNLSFHSLLSSFLLSPVSFSIFSPFMLENNPFQLRRCASFMGVRLTPEKAKKIKGYMLFL
jgi:hypothetical protein